MSQPTYQELFSGADRVIAILKAIHEGKYDYKDPEVTVQFEEGEYDYLEETIKKDGEISGFVRDNICLDYDEESHTIVVQMPVDNICEEFNRRVVDAINLQLQAIRSGSGKKANFARRVLPRRSIGFKLHNNTSVHCPDATFRHNADKYPSVVIELANLQKRKNLARLYSREATLYIYQPEIFNTPNGRKLRAVGKVVDEAFRDDDGNSVDHLGIQLYLSDFAALSTVKKELHDEGVEISISGQQLCEILNEAEHILNNIKIPQSVTGGPLTHPSGEKAFLHAHRVFELFNSIRNGTNTNEDPEIKIQLSKKEYAHLQERLEQNPTFCNYVQEKIPYYYDEKTRAVIVRMPSRIHECFLWKFDNHVQTQLASICSEHRKQANFAQRVDAWGSAMIEFEGSEVNYEPDISFGHDLAKFPGVIIEIGYSQNKKSLDRRAEDYLIDSEASIRAVICVKLPYQHEQSRNATCEATFTVWRPREFHTAEGPRLRAVAEVEDEVFRDQEGELVENRGIRLRLSDFTYEDLASEVLGDEDKEICISGMKLGEYLEMAECGVRGGTQGRHHLNPGTKGEKRSPSPEDQIHPIDEARYVAEMANEAARASDRDSNYGAGSSSGSPSGSSVELSAIQVRQA
ncbi:hypothetical protein yc1106_07988 [Curvularia clavata]|uniref:Uncharacterized protein n=1 Tax=Curvularia clavata TaxID=95742 RepID=A0A9Q8ZDM4_CURCL|nr:hypothetical protein yc1106_07988 [Curvularia clavata]